MPILEHVNDVQGSFSPRTKKIFGWLFWLAAVACIILFIGVYIYHKQQENARKRFYWTKRDLGIFRYMFHRGYAKSMSEQLAGLPLWILLRRTRWLWSFGKGINLRVSSERNFWLNTLSCDVRYSRRSSLRGAAHYNRKSRENDEQIHFLHNDKKLDFNTAKII